MANDLRYQQVQGMAWCQAIAQINNGFIFTFSEANGTEGQKSTNAGFHTFIEFSLYKGTAHTHKIDGLVLGRCNSSASAMELHLSCINPSKWDLYKESNCYSKSVMVPDNL